MSDTTNSNETNEPAEKVEGQEPEETTTEQGEQTPDNEQADSADKETEGEEGEQQKLSHDDALKALTKTRSEAASWRTKYRDLEAKLEGAKTPEEVEALVTEMKDERQKAEHALVVENVALKHQLPDDLAAVLAEASEGKSREQLEAHAKVLAKYAPSEEEAEPELQGGLRPGSTDESFDPYALAKQVRKRTR